jgi:hypothetical protein
MENEIIKPSSKTTLKNSNRMTSALDLLIDFLLEEYGRDIQTPIINKTKLKNKRQIITKLH